MTTNDIYALTFVVIMLAVALIVQSLIKPWAKETPKEAQQRKVFLPDSEAFIMRYEWVKWLAETATVEKGHAVFIMHELTQLDAMPGRDTERIKELRRKFEHRFADVIGGV